MSWVRREEFVPDDPEDEPIEEDEFESFDCHMTLHPKTHKPLGCGMAGSEECDVECPWRKRFGW